MTYGICRAMLRDVHEAEDATQQAFLSAYRALLGGARVRDSGSWIATIARNECRARISAGMRAPLSASDDALAEVPHGVDDVERRMQSGELRAALAELPERQREAVVLRYVYGLRYGEVAKALDLSRPATEALLFRARRAMRVRLRHVVGTALVVPLAVREELALAIPGFGSQAASSAAAAGLAGGVLAKLASAPAAAKLATATVAISTVGAVGVVESDRPAPGASAEARLVAEPKASARVSTRVADDRGGDEIVEPGEGRNRSGGDARSSESVDLEREERSAGPTEGSSAMGDESTDSPTRQRGSSTTDEGDDEPGASDDDGDSSGSGSGESHSSPGSDDEISEHDTSARSSGSRSSGSGSDDPDDLEGVDEPDDGSAGSGSDDDGESGGSSGSADYPDESP